MPADPVVITVSGPARSGKSTLGHALAAALDVRLIDADEVRGALPTAAWGELVAPELAAAGACVVVAPFGATLPTAPQWDALSAAVAPARVVNLLLVGHADLFAARGARSSSPSPVPADVTVVPVDAELGTAQQLARVLPILGARIAVDPNNPLFTRAFDAVVFDLDGTLVDSTGPVVRSWRRFATHFNLDFDVLQENHGQPARELIKTLLPPDQHDDAFALITEMETGDTDGLVAIRGAREVFADVPPSRVAIATSGSFAIASARLAAAGIEPPAVLVTADDVRIGKPDPEPYLLATERLGVDARHCLAVEDTPTGIAAARAAGCRVLALTGTVTVDELAGADLIVDGLDRVGVVVSDNGIRLVPGAV